MKMSDGLFLRCAREVAKGFPEITYGEHIVDNTCMQLVMNPYQYDTLLTGEPVWRYRERPVRGVRGRPGVGAGRQSWHRCAIFEAVHGSAPDIAGKDIANPTALLQSAILMLRYIGEDRNGRSRAGGVGEGLHREENADPRRGRDSGTKALPPAFWQLCRRRLVRTRPRNQT